jgi:hypothetical protein
MSNARSYIFILQLSNNINMAFQISYWILLLLLFEINIK